MAAAAGRAAAPSCPSCGTPIVRRYCPECGEKSAEGVDYSVRGLAYEAMHAFSPVDGKIVPTLRALFTKPGLLTAEYFAGRRRRYMRPLAFFLVVNVAFFLVVPYTGLYRYRMAQFVDVQAIQFRSPSMSAGTRIVATHLDASQETLIDFEQRFDRELRDNRKGALFLVIPLFALVLQLIYAGRRRHFAEHLVFSVHTWAFFLAFLGFGLTALFAAVQLPMMGLWKLGLPLAGVIDALSTEAALIVAIFIGLGAYLKAAVQRFYGDTGVRARATGIGLVVAQQLITIVYRESLFWTTLWSTGVWRPWH